MDVYTMSNYFIIIFQTSHSNTTSSFLSNVHYHNADTYIGRHSPWKQVLIGVNPYRIGAVKLEQYCI